MGGVSQLWLGGHTKVSSPINMAFATTCLPEFGAVFVVLNKGCGDENRSCFARIAPEWPARDTSFVPAYVPIPHVRLRMTGPVWNYRDCLDVFLRGDLMIVQSRVTLKILEVSLLRALFLINCYAPYRHCP